MPGRSNDKGNIGQCPSFNWVCSGVNEGDSWCTYGVRSSWISGRFNILARVSIKY